MKIERVSWEQMMLKPFVGLAKKYDQKPIMRQTGDNRIELGGNLYFQFGDLLVNTSSQHVVVEAETAGGVTNLVKYWYCIQKGSTNHAITKPVKLLHVFKTNSKNDYGSHLLLWKELWSKMKGELNGQLDATVFRVTRKNGKWEGEFADALGYFEQLLK